MSNQRHDIIETMIRVEQEKNVYFVVTFILFYSERQRLPGRHFWSKIYITSRSYKRESSTIRLKTNTALTIARQ